MESLPVCRSPIRGNITCIIGPMFSGKTTELLRMHDRQQIARRNCVLVKYAADERYDSDLIATHSKVKGNGKTLKAHHLWELRNELFQPDVQVVSIDEGQFFDDLTETCEELAQLGKQVYVAVLNGTFERKFQPFPQVSTLLPLCEQIKQVLAVCVDCGHDACYTFRSTKEMKVEVIGGQDTYKALCRYCFMDQSRMKVNNDDIEEMSQIETENEKLETVELPKMLKARNKAY